MRQTFVGKVMSLLFNMLSRLVITFLPRSKCLFYFWNQKEQYCIGTWNVSSMNQGKLEMVKQEMARLNIDSLGISELKWTGMGEFNSDDHYIYYCGQESLRRNAEAIMVNKRV